MNLSMKRIAFYGGSFDPFHCGHLTIGRELLKAFSLDEFYYVPAFHAPHKHSKPVSPLHRYAMLCLSTANDEKLKVSPIEIEAPERPYTFETLTRLNRELPDAQIYFVMGADSWQDIRTWREWELVLNLSNHIVVTRPGHEIGFSHVTDDIRAKVVDLRNLPAGPVPVSSSRDAIYVTDVVNLDISASGIRQDIRSAGEKWRTRVPAEVAKYIEKYQIYK